MTVFSGWIHTDAVKLCVCDKCLALPGQLCRTPQGKKTYQPHLARIERLRVENPASFERAQIMPSSPPVEPPVHINFLDFFDIKNPVHLKAWLVRVDVGCWPPDFVPRNVVFDECWETRLHRRISEHYARKEVAEHFVRSIP